MSSPLCLPIARATTANGDPISGALLHAYYTGTTTRVSVHTANGVEHTNPVVADAGGLFPSIYLSALTTYRFVLTDPAGAVIAEFDPVTIGVSGDHLNFGARLFTAYQNFNIPLGVDMVRTAGWDTLGRGDATYIADEAVDEEYVEANPRSAFISLNGRGFKLNERHLTPFMFGCVGDGEADDTVPLQAFFDYAFPIERVQGFTYDWRGNFGVSGTIYCAHPNHTAPVGPSYHPFFGRSFICGTLTPLANFAGDVDGMGLDNDVLVIAGVHSKHEGILFINGKFTTYANRRFNNGIRLIYCSRANFDTVIVEGAKRDCIVYETGYGWPGTVYNWDYDLRPGSPFNINFDDSNNIGVTFGAVYGRASGSNHWAQNFGVTLPYTGVLNGYVPGEIDQTFTSPVVAPYDVASPNQRTRITGLSSTAELRKGDIGYVRLEYPASAYGTLTPSLADSTFTFSAGDPVAAGLQVGDRIEFRNDPTKPLSTVLPQGGLWFTIMGFSGTSNRVVEVFPAPHDTYPVGSSFGTPGSPLGTLSGTLKLCTEKQFHQVMDIESSTAMVVYPALDPRLATGTWYSQHGFVANVQGGNTASTIFTFLGGITSGGILNAAGLYNCGVTEFLPEISELAIVHGASVYAVGLSLNIGKGHFEFNILDYLQITTYGSAFIGGASLMGYVEPTEGDLYSGPLRLSRRLGPRVELTDKGPPLGKSSTLTNLTVNTGGYQIECGNLQATERYVGVTNVNAVSNSPQYRRRSLLIVTGIFEIGIDEAALTRSGQNDEATVNWVHPTGGSLADNPMIVQLTYEMWKAGWTIVAPAFGPSAYAEDPQSVTAVEYEPTTVVSKVRFELTWDWTGKQVFVHAIEVA
jgi:hypothetical protein